MNTFKKFLGIALMLALLVCSVAAFASCGKKECTDHVDANRDGKCDNEGCGADVEIPPCTDHVDANSDNKCDVCDEDLTPEAPACTNHVDANRDGVCDTPGCGASVAIPAPPAKEVTYTVTVTCDGAPLAGAEIMVTEGKGNVTVTTDDTGTFTLSLMNNQNWVAKVLSLPYGYVTGEEYSKGYEFSDDYKTTIEVLKPNYVYYLYTFLEDVDEYAVADATVKFYKIVDGVADMDEPVETLTTDILGVCYTNELALADYLVVTELADNAGGILEVGDVESYYVEPTEEEEEPRDNGIGAYISYVPGSSEYAAITIDDFDGDGVVEFTVPAGKTVWYETRYPYLNSMVFSSADIEVAAMGATYKLGEGAETFEVPVVVTYMPFACAISAPNAEEDLTVTATLNIVIPEGVEENPIELESAGSTTVATQMFQDVYYVYTVAADGTLTVTREGENGVLAYLVIGDEMIWSENDEGIVASANVTAGTVVTIVVSGARTGGDVTFVVTETPATAE